MFTIGMEDALADDTFLMHKKWVEFGNGVSLDVWPRGPHGVGHFGVHATSKLGMACRKKLHHKIDLFIKHSWRFPAVEGHKPRRCHQILFGVLMIVASTFVLFVVNRSVQKNRSRPSHASSSSSSPLSPSSSAGSETLSPRPTSSGRHGRRRKHRQPGHTAETIRAARHG